MDFVKFTVTNKRGNIMTFMMLQHQADILIENIYNKGTNVIKIE